MLSPASQASEFIREGRAAFDVVDLDGAEAAFRGALSLYPGHAMTLYALGLVYRERRDFAAAEKALREALGQAGEQAPMIRAILGQIILAQGRWVEGFGLLDAWRQVAGHKASAAPELALPRWAGEPLNGRCLLIWCEEGLGDQIMYARFARELLEARENVVLAVRPELQPLLAKTGFRTAAKGDVVQAELYIPSSALPAAMMAGRDAPPALPYLSAEPKRTGARIGVVTRGNPNHWNDRHRSLAEPEAAWLRDALGAIDLAPESTGARNFLETAEIIAGLDLVVSVDTSVAHLAGAMGKPVWVLLSAFGVDWRWQLAEATTPWYPTMRLYRQAAPGCWREVLEAVTAEAAR